ncbi:hypothetical protein TrCOL_g12051 [Triparma columacea]|jgi:hypothetical protein|uniref:Uncharacterized protein n=1 Tax=Triparma columacea TaxID=722753 RepID=A0A9W7FW20_9STRA|nr:hypothetical protein TrCOL_g12051 [Triparma columacea]
MGLVTPSCCAIFSICGAVFLCSIGLILSSSGSLYIKGIEDPDKASTTAYLAAGCYASTFVLSLLFMIKDRRTDRSGSYDEAGYERLGGGEEAKSLLERSKQYGTY